MKAMCIILSTNICQHQRILKITPSSARVMLTSFCNINGVMHLEFMSMAARLPLSTATQGCTNWSLFWYAAGFSPSLKCRDSHECKKTYKYWLLWFHCLGPPTIQPKLGGHLFPNMKDIWQDITLYQMMRSKQWWRCSSVNKAHSSTVTVPWNYLNTVRTVWITDVSIFRSNCVKLLNEFQEIHILIV